MVEKALEGTAHEDLFKWLDDKLLLTAYHFSFFHFNTNISQMLKFYCFIISKYLMKNSKTAATPNAASGKGAPPAKVAAKTNWKDRLNETDYQ